MVGESCRYIPQQQSRCAIAFLGHGEHLLANCHADSEASARKLDSIPSEHALLPRDHLTQPRRQIVRSISQPRHPGQMVRNLNALVSTAHSKFRSANITSRSTPETSNNLNDTRAPGSARKAWTTTSIDELESTALALNEVPFTARIVSPT
jgi:hypothetical protein